MIHRTSKNATGTSFHGTTIEATPNQLISILGVPSRESGDGKITMDFVGGLDNTHVFTVYDWKYGRPIGMDETIEWHIGGFTLKDTEQAEKELKTLLNN